MQRLRKQRGFSLIELMVSLLIGMITVVVIMQVMAFSEGQKRTTTSGSDAQVNGNLALFTIERASKNAGWGLIGLINSIGCPIQATKGEEPTQIIMLAPVVITDGPNQDPDRIQFLLSTKSGISLPTSIVAPSRKNDPSPQAATFFVTSDIGIEQGDLMVAVPSNDPSKFCTLFQVTNDPNSGGGGSQGSGLGQNKAVHNSGLSDWNHAKNANFPDGGYDQGDYLINLGAMLQHTYLIINPNNTTAPRSLKLQAVNLAAGTTVIDDLYPNIVDLQALYGKDTSNPPDEIVDTWDTVTPAASSPQWRQIMAIKVAVLARSVNPEKEAVTFTEPTWNGNTKFNMSWDNSTSVWGDASWQHYRYKVYENTMPIRNLVWRQQ